MGGGLESSCVGRVYGADGAVEDARLKTLKFQQIYSFDYLICVSIQLKYNNYMCL
jgi:hypothetical protein